MKNVKIAFSFIKKNIVPVFIIMLMMLVVIFLLISIYGQFKYITYTRDIFRSSGLKNSVYFSNSVDFSNEHFTEEMKKLQQKVKEFKATENIIITDSVTLKYDSPARYLNGVKYDKTMIEDLEQPLKDGEWFHSETDPTKYEYPEVIIGGKDWNGVKTGDIIKLTYMDKVFQAKVIGTLGDTTFYPQFSSWGTSLGFNDLFSSSTFTLYLNVNSLNIELEENRYAGRISFIKIKEDASDTDKKELLDYLTANGNYYTYEQLMEQTDIEIEELMRESFPFPVFLILIATISMICISAVAVQRSMHEQSIYYLIGCSKKRSIVTMITTLLIFFGLPCLINIITAIFYPNFLRSDRIYNIEYIIDASCIAPVIIYFIFIAAVLVFLPIIIYRKHSPLTFYRRNL
jgi:hypothetical protein